MLKRVLLCEHLRDDEVCRAVKESEEGRIARNDLCVNPNRLLCCYVCSNQTSCEIGCNYLVQSRDTPNFEAQVDERIAELHELERLPTQSAEIKIEEETHEVAAQSFGEEIATLVGSKAGCSVSPRYFEIMRKRKARMGQERKLLSVAGAKVILIPEYGIGDSLLSFSRLFLGVVPRYFLTRAFENWIKSGLFDALTDDSQIEEGEIKDIVDKQVKLVELTLTNRNFLFLYEKGVMSKQQKLIAFPLDHAKTVETNKNDFVKIGYNVFQKGRDDPQHFDLVIFVTNADRWAKTIEDLVL